MAKCAACGRYLPVKGGATCCNLSCSNRYHLACLLLPESAKVSSDWLCPDCKKRVPRGDNSATPVKELSSGPSEVAVPTVVSASGAVTKSPVGVAQAQAKIGPDEIEQPAEPSPESQLTLREEIRLFRSELREVRVEMREFRREMAELNSSLGACTVRVDGLEARIQALENRQTDLPPDNKVSQLELAVSRLQLELNDRDQELLGSDLEVANIPEIPGENVLQTVGLVAATLGVKLEERDIVFAQRVGLRAEREPQTNAAAGVGMTGGTSPGGGAGAARGRRIVVRLARRALRD